MSYRRQIASPGLTRSLLRSTTLSSPTAERGSLNIKNVKQRALVNWGTLFIHILKPYLYSMIIHQFYDKGLAHASYAIIRDNRLILIDPARDPQPYYDFALLHEADIVGVIETHPHADFVSSHLEIHQTTGAIIYCSKLVGALYPHETFDDDDVIHLADIRLKAINTPGHSPDSICILLQDEDGKDVA
ncbi:MAG TPA: MBL fold metallo-hydrolase, partial [Mucilaginibacter sp.]|nr:MBL fold metallo-hydrolase [Mucilaginibacter sp.]